MYIGYDVKKGVKYAKLCTSRREGGRVVSTQVNLGRVVDEQRGVYMNRKRGMFTYDLATNTYGPAPADAVAPTPRVNARESLILDFGDAFFLNSYARAKGLAPAVDALGYGNRDSVWALLLYYALCRSSNSNAADWLEGSYARLLYPRAHLSGQRISDLLAAVGDEASWRAFFARYAVLLRRRDGEDVIIDSTGLPNSIHFPLTAVSNHNGQINEEVRLIYAVQRGTNLPLYLRYVPGNVVDVSTLTRTVRELREIGIDTRFALLDAGYLTDANARELVEAGVSFVTRLRGNRTLYKEIVAGHLPGLRRGENLVECNGRYAYVEHLECELVAGHAAHAYLCQDLATQQAQASCLFARASRTKMPPAEVHREMESLGVFVLVSTRRVARDDIIPLYRTRQEVEQVFDVCKNDTNMLPLRVRSEETFRGHLLMTFAATVLRKMLQEDLKGSGACPENALMALRNHKCKVYDDHVLTAEPAKKANDMYRRFAIKVKDRYEVAATG